MCLNNTVILDPGWNTGISIWTGDLHPLTHVIREPLKRKKIKIELKRLFYMVDQFKTILSLYPKLDTCYIEGVGLWSGSLRSMTAAKRGDTFALAYLVGLYAGVCYDRGMNVNLSYPGSDKKKERVGWKGQMNAQVIAKRIYRINQTTYPEHIREAVGIGFAIMGKL